MFSFLKKFKFLQIYSLAPKSGISYFLGYKIFTNARVENIRRQIFIDARVENIIGWPIKMEHKQTFSNLRQNQHTACLR
jgi:hypothetical protein